MATGMGIALGEYRSIKPTRNSPHFFKKILHFFKKLLDRAQTNRYILHVMCRFYLHFHILNEIITRTFGFIMFCPESFLNSFPK